MTNQQLELGFSAAKPTLPVRRERRLTRAAWWFAHMRQVVSQAIDWDAAPPPRPEQAWLGISRQRQSV